MGSLTKCCAASKLGINWGEQTTLMMMYYKYDDWYIIGLPIKAKYEDYGEYLLDPVDALPAEMTLSSLRESLCPAPELDVTNITWDQIWDRINRDELNVKSVYYSPGPRTWYVDQIKAIIGDLNKKLFNIRQVESSVLMTLSYDGQDETLASLLEIINASDEYQAIVVPSENRSPSILATLKYVKDGKRMWDKWDYENSHRLHIVPIRQDVWTYLTRRYSSYARPDLFQEHREKYLAEEAKEPKWGGDSYLRDHIDYQFKAGDFDRHTIKHARDAIKNNDPKLFARVCKYLAFRRNSRDMNLDYHVPRYTPQFAHDFVKDHKRWHDKLSKLSEKISKKDDE